MRGIGGGLAGVGVAGVRMQDGTLHELDVLVLATGFHADRFIRPATVTGRGEQTLDDPDGLAIRRLRRRQVATRARDLCDLVENDEDIAAALDQAGDFVPVEQAERRNLIMVNPVEGNVYATSRNIVAAYQMVKAGEKARSHRHTAAALRLVVEAKPGTYTVVDGARVDMAPGAVVLTP